MKRLSRRRKKWAKKGTWWSFKTGPVPSILAHLINWSIMNRWVR